MNERIEKFKFHRQLRKIDWDSVINATNQTAKKFKPNKSTAQ